MFDALEFPLVRMIRPPDEGEFKLRIGLGREDGFIKLGPASEADPPDYVVDIKAEWPIDDGMVDAIFLANQLQRLTMPERFALMDEAWRVLKSGGKLFSVTPYWASARAFADPLAQWPPIAELHYLVYSRVWRKMEGLGELPLKCDFTTMTPQGAVVIPAGHVPDPEIALRNDEYRAFAAKHYLNAVQDLHVTLDKT